MRGNLLKRFNLKGSFSTCSVFDKITIPGIRISSANDLATFGRNLSTLLSIGDICLMKGDVGAGKTTVTGHIIRSLSDNPSLQVTSPTYLFDNTYNVPFKGKICTIHHVDLYRVSKNADIARRTLKNIDIPMMFDNKSDNLIFIEWPNKLEIKRHENSVRDFMPLEYIEVNIDIVGDVDLQADENRMIHMSFHGSKYKSFKEIDVLKTLTLKLDEKAGYV